MTDKEMSIARFKEEFTTFEEASHKYEAQSISAEEYSSVSKGFGQYLQRDNQQMLRIRILGGRMTMRMVGAILKVCEYYRVEVLKITAGQALQLHDLDPHAGRRLILRLLDKGIVTRGSGGDNPNNVSASALSGVEKGEYFDVQPYAQAADTYLLKYTGIQPLPRKFKIGFSNSPLNETHATFKDLGFVARPDQTFDVYAAGGLGINPKLGVKVAEQVKPEEILYHMRTMLDVYMENGNYENRHKARSRFLQDTMGVEGFIRAYQEHLSEVVEDSDLTIAVLDKEYKKAGEADTQVAAEARVIEQKQEGLYAVSYHPIGGYLSLQKLHEIYALVNEWEDAEIRLANDGGLYVINLTASEAKKVLAITEDGAIDDISCSVTCVGRRRCDIGSADSQKLLKDCLAAVEKENFSKGTLPVMHISGCISSCGSQHVGEIGWRGALRKTEEGTKEAYFFSYGGRERQGEEKLVYAKQVILAEKIPMFLVELGRTVEAAGKTFGEWLEGNEEELNNIVDQYAM